MVVIKSRPSKMKFFWYQGIFFSWNLISKMYLKINSRIITENLAADSKISKPDNLGVNFIAILLTFKTEKSDRFSRCVRFDIESSKTSISSCSVNISGLSARSSEISLLASSSVQPLIAVVRCIISIEVSKFGEKFGGFESSHLGGFDPSLLKFLIESCESFPQAASLRSWKKYF